MGFLNIRRSSPVDMGHDIQQPIQLREERVLRTTQSVHRPQDVVVRTEQVSVERVGADTAGKASQNVAR